MYAVEDGVLTRQLTDLGSAPGNAWILLGITDTQYRYYHLSTFAPGLTAGSTVRQGDVIGYVGSTGWATGPHLHYEFRVNDEARNPLSIAMPNDAPLPPEAFTAFLTHIEPLANQLALARDLPGSRIASGD